MFRIPDIFGECILACGLALGLLVPLAGAQAASLQVLYTFQGGKDGSFPDPGLVADKAGNLYGMTLRGGEVGTGKDPCKEAGCGTVFELAPDGTKKMLFAFCPRSCSGGNSPESGLIIDKAGNVYGTTRGGGPKSSACFEGCGVVFKLAPDGTETVVYAFNGGSDGEYPYASLVADKLGNLYGTTTGGGMGCSCGTVFKVVPDGTETVLYAFSGGNDGDIPAAGLISDGAGNLYGTTRGGGGTSCNSGYGCGVVFRLAPDGTETVLYAFKGGSDGAYPYGGLLADASGNLFGTTAGGGGTNCNDGYGCGVVFKLAPDGTETVLHAFTGGSDGFSPANALVADGQGNLYGAAAGGSGGGGTIFKVAPDGTETVFYAFTGGSVGANPSGSLILRKGYFYGVAGGGGGSGCSGSGCGIVFALKHRN